MVIFIDDFHLIVLVSIPSLGALFTAVHVVPRQLVCREEGLQTLPEGGVGPPPPPHQPR